MVALPPIDLRETMCTGTRAFYASKRLEPEVVRKTYDEVYREQIEQGFKNAGWFIDSGFSDYLVIGSNGDDLSILVHAEALETNGGTVFELVDHERNVTYRVQKVPTPQQAVQLLLEHGQPPQES